MKVIENYNCGEWCSGVGIETVDSIRWYEDYGKVRIYNETVAFISQKGFNHYNVSKYLPVLERMFVLDKLGALDDYGKWILKRVLKQDGTMMEEVNLSEFEGNSMKKYSAETIEKEIGKSSLSGVPLFQIRMYWEVKTGNYCHRCWRESFTNDWMQFVYGRFGFGFIDGKYLHTYRTILFRKF